MLLSLLKCSSFKIGLQVGLLIGGLKCPKFENLLSFCSKPCFELVVNSELTFLIPLWMDFYYDDLEKIEAISSSANN